MIKLYLSIYHCISINVHSNCKFKMFHQRVIEMAQWLKVLVDKYDDHIQSPMWWKISNDSYKLSFGHHIYAMGCAY